MALTGAMCSCQLCGVRTGGVEYDAPDAEGLQGCPRHPDVPRFNAARGECPACAAHPTSPVDPEHELGLGERLCLEADRRGLPDSMMVEDRFWSAWAFQTKRAEACARRADDLYESSNPDDIDRAIRLEAAAAKWADSSTKAGKIASGSVTERERLAGLDRRARALKVPGQPEVH